MSVNTPPHRDTSLLQQEADHWDAINVRRKAEGFIALEADARRATRSGPCEQDPVMHRILYGRQIDAFINWVAHAPSGRVLDVCCGPGWLALELGRRGQIVDAFDLSPNAIELAGRMLAENPYREGFGQVTYQVQDVTTLDLGEARYDSVSGWSAFHHLQDLPGFLDRVRRSLKPGGIVATMDDLPTGRLERWLGMLFVGILPTHGLSYRRKALGVLGRVSGKRVDKQENPLARPASPLEAICTGEIEPLFRSKFEVLENFRFGAFAGSSVVTLKGPDWLRHTLARAITSLDRLLCRWGIAKGRYRIIVARKKPLPLAD